MRYRVKLTGVVVVDADSPEQAEARARERTAMLDKRAECLGPVTDQSLQPINARHFQKPTMR